ncbi:efflux RND transporter permease subunit [soil metagenome]
MIAWFARNPVAANLLMAAIAVAGIFTLVTGRVPLEVFPQFDSDTVSISVPYRGSTPEEVEESVVIRIEEAILDVDGIERIISTASENSARVQVEVDDDFDRRAVLDDLKARVDAISTFPPDAERPIVALGDTYREVINVVLSGDLSEGDLRRLGEAIRDDIANLPEVTRADLQGVRPYEITVSIDEASLQEFGLSFASISAALRAASIDVPAGTLKTPSGEVVLRSKGRAYTGSEFGSIPVASLPDGSRLLLSDVATVDDSFNENPFIARYNGQRCVLIGVSREGNQSAIAIAETIKEYLEEAKATLPPGVQIHYWNDRSRIVKDRLDTLVDSAMKSMLLVFVVLALFLRPMLAFWVVVGIPVCFLGAIALMPFLGVSINIISLFGFILVLGVVVDDAIVTGENIYTHQRRGAPPMVAAVTGAEEVALPVVFGVLTTILAFVPLLLGEGFNGKWNAQIALIVIPVLLWSLVESKLILPAHLSHTRFGSDADPPGRLSRYERFQGFFSRGLERFVARIYQPLLARALRYRYVSAAIFLGVFLVLLGFLLGGHISYIPFPRVQSERATVRLTMQEGAPFELTKSHIDRMERIAEEMRQELVGADGVPVIQEIVTAIGGHGITSSRGGGTVGESHLGEVVFHVAPPEERALEISTSEVVNDWRQRIGPIVGAQELVFRSEIFRGGDPIDIQLRSPHFDDLTEAAAQVRDHLATYPDLFDISDSLDTRRDEIQLTIRPEAQQFGLTTEALARQVRQAFYGEEVQRMQRGRDEVRVFLRYPERQRKSLATLQEMRIRTPDGSEVPFSSVAQATMAKSLPTIRRVDRARTVDVTADVDKENIDLPSVKLSIAAFVDDLIKKYPAMNYSFEGEAREERESAAAQKAGGLLILFGIYAMLAIPFRSYTQPLIVMSVIPFGLIGAVLGHAYEGLTLSRLSYFGMLALAGVVVNDSLVMVDYMNRRRRGGMGALEAASTAGAARFRAIILTSITTFAGLYPLLRLESTQAQFLIPMAVSLGYGILFATAITLILVPVNYLILEDLKVLSSKLPGRRAAAPRLPDPVADSP